MFSSPKIKNVESYPEKGGKHGPISWEITIKTPSWPGAQLGGGVRLFPTSQKRAKNGIF